MMTAALTFTDIPWTPVVDQPRVVAFAPGVHADALAGDASESRRPPEYQDLVITELADGEAEALERAAALADALADLQTQYNAQREAYHTAVGMLAQVTAHLEAARRTIHALRHTERQYGTGTWAA